MALQKKKKDSLIKSFKTHANDTGSPQVQIAILSEEIRELASHLKKHKHDFSARRGLMRKIGQRRRLLVYLQREDMAAYDELIKQLGLKRKIVEDQVILGDEEEMLAEEKDNDSDDDHDSKNEE